jgi:hypothetical protein
MKLFTAVIAFFFLIRCSNNNNENNDSGAVADTTQYFQVNHFINKEIEEVKRVPYFIYMLSKEGDVQDSTPIDNNKFIQLAKPFTEIDLNDKKVKKHYTETVFEDLTSASYVLNYKAQDPSLVIQNIDIMLHNETQQVKRIDLRKMYVNNDTSYTEHLVWKTKESFQIIKSAVIDTMQRTSQIQVIWNSKN